MKRLPPPPPVETTGLPRPEPVILLIRHGESEANAGLPTPSPAEIRLTGRGHAQAAALAGRFASPPDLVVVSPYRRTRETAAPLLAALRVPRVEEWPIEEFTYLDTRRLAGTTEAERSGVVKEYWDRCDPFATFGEGAESFARFVARVDAMIERLRGPGKVRSAAVFTHGYVIHATALRLREPGAPVDAGMMRRFRGSWAENAPGHCEVRRVAMAAKAGEEPVVPLAETAIVL